MSLLRKFRRHLPSKDTVKKILWSLTAFSLFAGNAHASEITDADGNSLIDGNPVHDLYAQELDGNLARSVYDKFSLSENEIANMHFNKQGGDQFAFNLVNFVNERVDVNGTINAIRDGAIDGNLYFLSPEGIAVGSSGVINAGGFTAYAVSSSDFDDLVDADMSDLRTQLATNINNGLLTASEKSVEINGVINARNRIALRGQSITVNDGAHLNADKNIDFTNLVNAGNTVENIQNLKMTVDPEGSGDVYISVSQEHSANDSFLSTLGGEALSVWPGNKTTTLEPTINMNGTIDATGKVSFGAKATTTFSEGSVFNLIGSVKGSFLNQLGIDIDADWIDKTNNATINVGGNVKAGGDVTFDASAKTSATVLSETAAKRNAVGISNFIPTMAFIYAESDNNAVIDVKGTVDAGGKVEAKAEATTSLSLSAVSATGANDDGNSSVLYTAIGVANADNEAKIDFNTVNAKGDFTANATGTYKVDNHVTTVMPDSSFLATAIGVNEGDSKATVNLNGDITAGGKIDVDANDKDVFSRLNTSNEIGSRGLNNPFQVQGSGTTDTLFSALFEKIGATDFIGDHSFNIMSGDSMVSKLLTGEIFKAGVTVGVLSNNHDAKINVADGRKLTAGGDLSIDANLNTAALHSDVTNVLNNKTEGSDTKAGISAAINVVDVDNNANVIVERNAELSGKNVSVNSSTKADYDQFDAEMDYIKAAWTNFIKTCEQFGADFTTGGSDEVEEAIDELEGIDDKVEYAQKMAEIQDKINERYNDYTFKQFTDMFEDGANMYVTLKSALKRTLGVIDPANYVNFYARTSVQDNKSGDSASKADITGAVQVIGIDDNALTLLGEGVKVTGTDKADLTSTSSTDIVELTGQGGKYLATNNAGAGTGVGASVVITGIDGYATTVVGKNNQIAAPTVNVTADNNVDQLGIIYGAGLAGKIGVSGMVNMMYGDSFAIASIDDQTNINAPTALTVKGKNETDIIAVTGGVTLGDKSTSAAVGAGVNINNFDVHSFATIADNSYDQSVEDPVLTTAAIAEITAAVDKDIAEGKIDSDDRDDAIEEAKAVYKKDKLTNDPAVNVEVKRIEFVKALRKTLTDDQVDQLGAAGSAQGTINAGDITVNATTDGTINSVAIEGSFIGDSTSGFDSFNKVMNAPDDFSQMGNSMLNFPGKKLSSSLGGKASGLLNRGGQSGGQNLYVDNEDAGGRHGAMDDSQNGGGLDREVNDSNQIDNDEVENEDDDDYGDDQGLGLDKDLSDISFQLAGAGSVAVNCSDGDTVALLDNSAVNVKNLTVKSTDDLYSGAYSGGAAVTWSSKSKSQKNGTVGAAAAVNQGARRVDALLANSAVNTTGGDLTVNAIKNGVDVATALGLAVSVTQGSENVNIAAGVGVNLADNDVRAHIVNSDTGSNDKSFDKFKVNAASNDVLVAGGADIAVALGTGGSSTTATATVMISELDNDLQAGIYNGNHFANNADISTTKSDVVVDAALSVGVSSSSDSGYKGKGNPYAFSGTVTYGELTSTSDAFIKGATITASNVNLLNDQKANDNPNRQTLEDQGLDITGAGYLGEQAKKQVDLEHTDGAVVVGAAVGVQFAYTSSQSSAAVPIGASVAVNNVNIDDTVSINNATINTDKLVADSYDKLRLVNVSAGLAGSYSGTKSGGSGGSGGSGAGGAFTDKIALIHTGDNITTRNGLNIVGSVGWNVGSINNAVSVKDSNITAHTLTVGSENDSQAVNVAGEISVSDGNSVGLALASNALNNTVESTIKDTTVNGLADGSNSIDIDAVNKSKVVEVGACLNITAASSLNGNVAINKGTNSTKAIADGLTATNIDRLDITSDDTATKTTVAGMINISGNAALGVAVAYSAIGDDDNKEILEATLKNSNIDARNGGKISLNTKDDSTITDVAAGVGVSFGANKDGDFKFNVQGAGAASYITKDVDAGLINTNVTGAPDLDIAANSDGTITTVAAIVAGSRNATITGTVGVAVSKINQDTDAFFKNDMLNETASALGNVDIRAASNQDITGGVGSGSLNIGESAILTAAGSGSHNQIDSNTRALVQNVNASATKNFGVVSQSDDILANYAGAVELSNGTVGLGISASNNKINGDTTAKVTGSTLSVAGSDSTDDLIAVNHGIKDGAMISKAVDDNTWSAGGLADNRTSENLSGIVVDASSTHGLSSDLASLAVQFSDTGVSIAGSLNFVKIGGKTEAAFDNSINAALNGKAGSVNVGAYDYTNKGGFIGGAAGAANFAAGFSVGVTDVERNVTASVNNIGETALDIAAKNFNVNAVSKQGISDFLLNAAVAVDDSFALETADNVASNSNTSTTTAKVNNVNVNYTGDANVGSEHSLNANTLNVAAGVSIALNPEESVAGSLNTGIAVTQDDATVKNDITNAKLLGADTSTANISTVNSSRINNDLFSIGGAVAAISAGVAGDIAVNSMETTTQSSIDNSTVKAGTINVTTTDNIDLEVDGGAGAFGSLAGVGAVVNVNTINNTTNANITGSTLEATDALNVDTKEVRNFDSTLVAAGLAGIGAGTGAAINVMVTTVNSNVGDIDSAYTRKVLDGHMDKANEDLVDTDEIHGMSTADKEALKESQEKVKVSTAAVKSEGVITNVAGSTLKAGGALKINSTEKNDGDIVNGSGALGGLAGVAVGDNILHVNHKTKTLLTTSDITGGTVDIGSTQTQEKDGLKTEVYEVGVGMFEVGVGYNSVQLKGETVIDVKGSNVTATNGDMNLTATDDAKTDAENLGVNIGVVGVPVTAAKSTNESATTVMIENSAREDGITSDLSATGALNVKARSANEAYVEAESASGGALVVASTMTTARDNNKASVLVNDGNNRFAGSSVSLTAEADPKLRTYSPTGSIQVVGFTYVQAETELKGGAEVAVGSGNRFDTSTVNYKAQTGSSDRTRTAANAELRSINGGGISIDTEPNTAKVTTETTTSVKVGSQKYNDSTAINVDSLSQPIRDAYSNGYTIGILASSGRDRAKIDAKDKVIAEIGSGTSIENKAGSLTVNATNTNLTDLKATGGTGGILDIASQSTTENDSNIDVTAKVGGNWNISGAMSINATSDDTVRGYARQGHGGLAGGAGVYADSNIKGTTQATVTDNAEITAGSIEVNALNRFKTDGYKGDESFLLADYYGGALTGDKLSSDVVVDKKAYTDVNAGATITTSGAQTYTAKSDGNLMNKINAAGGGLINGVGAYADTAITTDNEVRFAAGSKATATGESDFTVKAYDLLNVDSSSKGTNGGVMAVLINHTNNDLDRKNYIDVKGDLSTGGNFDLEAGGTKDAFFDDKARQVYIKTVTESNNYTLLQISSPVANISLKENNAINVDGSIDSGRDINMRADGGKVEFLYSSRTGLYSNLEKFDGTGVPDLSKADKEVEQGTYETNILGTGGANDQSQKEKDGVNTNYVTVNGSLTAGSAVKDVAVNISGKVVPERYNIFGTDNNGKLTVESDIDLKTTEDDFDYATALDSRRQALLKLIDQYTTGEQSSEDNTSVISGFQMEIERIEEKMRELGLNTGSTLLTGGIYVRSIELGDIALSGGNVNLNTAAVKGTGSIAAKGAPNLTITNTSNAYLKVNDIRLGGESGNVNVKGHAVAYAGEEGIADTIKLDTAMLSGAGNVTIYNNPDISTLRISSPAEPNNRSLDDDYTPHPDLRILGNIDNVNGDVRITNTRGDIDIAGPIEYDENNNVISAASTANVNGRNIYIEAQGTINQGYIEGMVNVGGNPEYVLRADATAAVNKAHDELNLTKNDSKTYTVKENAVNGGTNNIENQAGNAVNGRIAGNNIYLAALDINVNGIIQAGYDTYTATVEDADIETLKTELAENNTDALNLRMKDSSGRYAVNAAGAVYNAKQGFCDYELPVYYDATDNKLVMEPVVTGGGKVYLSGRIASTGSGRIYAANGYASIAVNNNTDLPMETGTIINNERSGKITIVDTALDTRTEYTPGQTLVINNYSSLLKQHGATDAGMEKIYGLATTTDNNIGYLDTDTGVPATTIYEPATGMRYYWAQGEKTMTQHIYHHREAGLGILFTDFLFGLVIPTGAAKDRIEEWEKDTTPRTTDDRSELDKGGFLQTGGSTDDNMNLKADSVLLDTTGPILIARDTKVISAIIANKYIFTLDWKYIYGSQQTYTFDINASKPITVGFFGRRTGPVTVNSGGSLYVNGDVSMSDGEALLTLNSYHGGVYQAGGTLIKTGGATIHALNDISGINIETMGRYDKDLKKYYDEIPLDIESSGGGDIDINVVGGTTAGYALPGDIFFGGEGVKSATSDGSKRGDVTVTTTGNILGQNGSTGKTIVLTSANGRVGDSKETPLTIDASNAVEVNANGDIYLSGPYNGTLKIGALSSTDGEVHVSKSGMLGKVEQTASYQTGVKYVDQETLIHQWIDQGIIAPTEDYAGTYVAGLKARVTEYEERIGEEYATYEAGKEAYADLKSKTTSEYAEYESIKEGYNDYRNEVDKDFSAYLTTTRRIRSECTSQYATMLEYQAKKLANEQDPAHNKALTKTQAKKLSTYEAKYAGFDSGEAYYIVNARTLVTEPEYQKFVGYEDLDAYMITTRQGQLMSKYSDYDSADAYLATTNAYALDQKFGAYASVAAYLAADAQYKTLVNESENPTYASTLEDMLSQTEIVPPTEGYHVNAKHFYVDNARLK